MYMYLYKSVHMSLTVLLALDFLTTNLSKYAMQDKKGEICKFQTQLMKKRTSKLYIESTKVENTLAKCNTALISKFTQKQQILQTEN